MSSEWLSADVSLSLFSEPDEDRLFDSISPFSEFGEDGMLVSLYSGFGDAE